VILTVPIDKVLYPTLGPQVCAFMEENLCFGPGDLRGQPLVLDDERRGLIYSLYEIEPQYIKDGRRRLKSPRAGRRRFQRAGLSLAKGKAKTELAALIAACELHPDAPVRCTGWTKGGEPIGGPVDDPYIPMFAVSEEQSDELAFGALRVILELSHLKDDFDIGLARIMRLKGDGKAESLAQNPDASDGARTTFTVFDETHRFTMRRFIETHSTMLNNLPKRKKANAWALEITTAPEPGAGSVAEATMNYAQQIADGKIKNASFFYFHMQAGDYHDLKTPEGRRAAVIEASGAAAEWRDIDGIVSLYDAPDWDKQYWERVWCNRMVQGSTQAFDVQHVKTLQVVRSIGSRKELITLGFDGAMFHDSTGLVATHIKTGFQWKAGLWECPPGGDKFDPPWQVPENEVDETVKRLFSTYNVWRMYADPPYWASWISKWVGDFGKDRVVEWFTNRRQPMAAALKTYETALKTGALSHDGDPDLLRHIGNARKQEIPGWKDEKGQSFWLIRKEHPESPKKIDLAMASVLSWEARKDALAAGLLKVRSGERGRARVWTPEGFRDIDPGPQPAAPA